MELKQFQSLIEKIITLSEAAKLQLSKHDLTKEQFAQLMGVIAESKFVAELDLKGNKLDVEAAKHLGLALAKNKSITKLDISECGLQYASLKHITDGLKGNTALENFSIAGNSLLKAVGTSHPALLIAELVRINKSILSLDLSHTGIGVDGMSYLAKGIISASVLRELKLHNIGFSAKGFFDLYEIPNMLKLNPSLTSLDLSGNTITSFCLQEIAKVLQHRKQKLQTLNLTNTGLAEKELAMLDKVFQHNPLKPQMNAEHSKYSWAWAFASEEEQQEEEERLAGLAGTEKEADLDRKLELERKAVRERKACDTPASASDTSMSTGDTPRSASDSTMSTSDTPRSTSDTPMSARGTPMSTRDTPMSTSNTPISAGVSPLNTNDTPLNESDAALLENLEEHFLEYDRLRSAEVQLPNIVPAIYIFPREKSLKPTPVLATSSSTLAL